jgi:hypothetical protein
MGTDRFGFYLSTNEFSINGPAFNGAQIYAMSKAQLAAGITPPVQLLSGIPLAESISYTLQPATTPAGGAYETGNGGTEYFLSALDFNAKLDNRIAAWAVTNTSSLNTTPAVVLHPPVVSTSESYGQPPDATQKNGPTPLKDAEAAGLEGVKSVEHLELLAGNDDRMNQTVFAAGKLWSNVNTVVKTPTGNTQIGTAWFAVSPSWNGSTLSASIAGQGYVSVDKQNIMYGAIGVNNAGAAVMGVTLVGPSYFPSAAWTAISLTSGAGPVHIVGPGAGPEDGFTGYRIEGGFGTSRWGDYGASATDENGDIWVGNENTSATRTLFADWGTFVTKVHP